MSVTMSVPGRMAVQMTFLVAVVAVTIVPRRMTVVVMPWRMTMVKMPRWVSIDRGMMTDVDVVMRQQCMPEHCGADAKSKPLKTPPLPAAGRSR